MHLIQFPAPEQSLLRHSGDTVTFSLTVEGAAYGRAFLRTSLGGARRRRREIIESMDEGRPARALDWNDIPMEPRPSTDGRLRFSVRLPLIDIGSFHAKCCFFAENSGKPEWPLGGDVLIKVAPAWTLRWNSIYCAFPRQFLPSCTEEYSKPDPDEVLRLESEGYTVIPRSGTFRSLIRRLDTILLEERFRIIQVLPVHPVPTTFARMGRFGSPFAGTDFLSVNPALAEFDTGATPLDQFRELVEAVHTRGARLFIDLPANHTGWASTLQIHHPEWFKRAENGLFISPGAWGTVWEDLVELDYSHAELREFMASVFEFWCAQGVDGFRCDAGYMVPAETWRYITARIREQFPETVFLLEGLGGKISVTQDLIAEQGLDWAYSEIFQTEDRSAFEAYLPAAQAMSENIGPLAHYAETHDNNRLASRSHTYAKMRTALSALASTQGCFGITNGVEWFAAEKIDVHRACALRWGAPENQVAAIRRLNTILASLPAFSAGASVRLIQQGPGNSIALLRTPQFSSDTGTVSSATDPRASLFPCLILANLDDRATQPVSWERSSGFDIHCAQAVFDSATPDGTPGDRTPALADSLLLQPGQVLCFTTDPSACATVARLLQAPTDALFRPEAIRWQELRMAALRLRRLLTRGRPLDPEENVDELASCLAHNPVDAIRRFIPEGSMPPVTTCSFPVDVHRVVPLPIGNLLLVRAPHPFRARLEYNAGNRFHRKTVISFHLSDGTSAAFVDHPAATAERPFEARLVMEVSCPGKPLHDTIRIQVLPRATPHRPAVRTTFSGAEVLRGNFVALLTNGCGAMSHVRARWGTVESQYDAILAANPDPFVPCDRQILFTRCRAWLINQGFSTELNTACLVSFESTREYACWLFHVPAGTGRIVPISLTLTLANGENRAKLLVKRLPAQPEAQMLEDSASVQLVLRPDIESRSFHHKTKAFAGPEKDWASAVESSASGFVFRPPFATPLSLQASGASFTCEPEWHYMVANPAEQVRGQDGSCDLYSPGWFSATLASGAETSLEAFIPDAPPPRPLRMSAPASAAPATLRGQLSGALRDFVVRRGDNATVIAGYPWFLDWGRDTFIVLRGMIADGLIDESLSIIRTFGAFEENGTLPNMICGNDASNRDTSDAQLWYCVAVSDLCRKIGREKVLSMICTPSARTVSKVVRSIAEGYVKGTPNGIRMDELSALIYSPSHYTWMDTNFPAGTPRQGYPVEIQALWIATLNFVSTLDPAGPWKKLSARAQNSLLAYFRKPGQRFLSDCLHAPHFMPAKDAVADDHLRCNQLFAITLGAVTQHDIQTEILASAEALLVPGSIRTLAPSRVSYELPVYGPHGALNDPAAPYWGRYEGDEDTRRKPAYHNGTAWAWPFPSYAEAIVQIYGASALPAARSLLTTAVPLLEQDCIGHLPEIADGDAPHTGRGCDAQAWSVSEFLRLAHLLNL